MDEYTAEAFANRDEPIPVIAHSTANVNGSSLEADGEGRRQKLRSPLSPSRQKSRPVQISTAEQEKDETPATPSLRTSIQDRLFSSLLRQVVPTDDPEEGSSATPIDSRSNLYVSRPAFSLPVMTNNFRRFNARIGIVFVFQNRLIRLFTWRTPTHTLSFLATYTFVCLDPHLLIVVPMAIALFYIMIPAFTSRHPPPPPVTNASMAREYHQAFTGPALAPATVIKPASETSKDFFRNMRDLQNSMADFSNAHDALVNTIGPATNFSDETFSSQLFLYLTILTTLSFITAHLLPWRLIFLLTGWGFTVSSHPTAQTYLLKLRTQAEQQTNLALNDVNHKHQKYIPNTGIPLPATPHAIQSSFAKFSEITLSSTPETREVEIFELQHRPLSSITSAKKPAAEWQPHLFTSQPYDPLSPARIAGDRPRGTRFFEDVAPPEGWEWASKKWELDLEAGEWVNERLVVGVEYDVLNHDADDDEEEPTSAQTVTGPPDDEEDREGTRLRRISTNRRESINVDFGGWVWDLPPAPGSGVNREDDLWLAYGDYEVPKVGVRSTSKEEEKARKKREKEKEKRGKKEKTGVQDRDWEEAARMENRGRTGEWRRRRWVRLVKRKVTT
ncbi:Integral peroxisomal membrane peroxin family protein [Cladophialophora carrionii]|uniref:Integral peroxisomal membrane peroxin family protein n=1 Tax=Cladophialophora carrionii TaxID=86049 RepID=A0A1C1CHS9_9EURO|nr:Integral peroxisomal membrane peroxin family protein [Cladophialophora carrionii]